MEKSSYNWSVVRLVFVVLSAPAWLLIRSAMSDDFSAQPPWYFPLIVVAFALLSVVAWHSVRGDLEWQRPSWSANPFKPGAPLEGVHMSGWSFLAGAVGLLVTNMFQPDTTDWGWVLPASVGFGLLAGVQVVAVGDAS